MQPCVLVDASCPSSGSEKLTPRALHPPHPPQRSLPCLVVIHGCLSWLCSRPMCLCLFALGMRCWRNWVSQYLKLFCLSSPHHAAKECNPGSSAAVIKFCVWSNDTVTLNRARCYWLRLGSVKIRHCSNTVTSVVADIQSWPQHLHDVKWKTCCLFLPLY